MSNFANDRRWNWEQYPDSSRAAFSCHTTIVRMADRSWTHLLSYQITRISILAIISLTLFEDDLEQACMCRLIARSQFGRRLLVWGKRLGARTRRGGLRLKSDSHGKQGNDDLV